MDHRGLPEVAAGIYDHGPSGNFRLFIFHWDYTVVQFLLRLRVDGTSRALLLAGALVIALAPLSLAAGKKSKVQPASVPQLELEGGRKLSFERSFWSEPEVHLKRGFWTKVFDIVAGAPDFHGLIGPYGVAVDSRGRIIPPEVL